MKKLTILQICWAAYLAICVFGSYRIFEWVAMRRVLTDIDPQVVIVKNIPKEALLSDRIQAVDRFAKVLAVVDASHTPKDFRDAFELWKAAWASLDRKMEAYDFPVGKNFAERQLLNETGTRLDQIKVKYGFGSNGAAPVKSIIGEIGDGLVDLGIGTYFLLAGLGVCKVSKDPVRNEMLRQKWSGGAMLVGLFLFSEGVFKLYSGFT